MELNNLEKDMKLNNQLTIENKQKNFLETTLGKTINTAIDIGIRAVLPEFIEDQIINIKNNLLNYGIKDGINKTINEAVDLGKNIMGIVTGNFDSISQMKNAVQAGGLIDGVSSLLDVAIDKAGKAGVMNPTILKTIKQGKNIILNNVENNIKKTFNQQFEAIEKAEKYIKNWKECFNEKDFSGMEKEYRKIEKQINSIAPIEKIINDINSIEILHNLIKNNQQNFDLTQEQLELVEKLK